MNPAKSVTLHRNDDGSYWADTARGRVRITPDYSESGRVMGWYTALEEDERTEVIPYTYRLREIRADIARMAAEAETVKEESPRAVAHPTTASHAGLATGDVILAIDGHQLPDPLTVEGTRRAEDGAVRLVHASPSGVEWWLYPATGDEFTVQRPPAPEGMLRSDGSDWRTQGGAPALRDTAEREQRALAVVAANGPDPRVVYAANRTVSATQRTAMLAAERDGGQFPASTHGTTTYGLTARGLAEYAGYEVHRRTARGGHLVPAFRLTPAGRAWLAADRRRRSP